MRRDLGDMIWPDRGRSAGLGSWRGAPGGRPGSGPARRQLRPRGTGPGGSHGPRRRGPVLMLFGGAAAVAFAVAATVIPIAMSGNLTALPAFGPQPCAQAQVQLTASRQAKTSIPANYLASYQQAGARSQIPWVVLAGIGEVESDHGRVKAPGVRSGQNGFGAAGPMQIGIGGAAGNEWGGAPVHPARQHFAGVATDGNRDGVDNVYDPSDAIPAAARFLVGHGAPADLPGAIFAYNHLQSYVQDVLSWASVYASGGFSVGAANLDNGSSCVDSLTGFVPNQAVSAAISYAEQQLGKPYLWGGTGPDSFDCSGLVMMAYRAAGIGIPRTSQALWAFGPRIEAGHEQPGDLVFFPGADGTPTSPGHVGMVLGGGMMIEAEQTGVPIHIVSYAGRGPVGFTRPWAHAGIVLPAG